MFHAFRKFDKESDSPYNILDLPLRYISGWGFKLKIETEQ